MLLPGAGFCGYDTRRIQTPGSYASKVFADMYRRGFRPGIDNQSPAFLADFDLINRWMKEQERIACRIARLEKASGKTTEQALHEKYLLNAGRGSQSY